MLLFDPIYKAYNIANRTNAATFEEKLLLFRALCSNLVYIGMTNSSQTIFYIKNTRFVWYSVDTYNNIWYRKYIKFGGDNVNTGFYFSISEAIGYNFRDIQLKFATIFLSLHRYTIFFYSERNHIRVLLASVVFSKNRLFSSHISMVYAARKLNL